MLLEWVVHYFESRAEEATKRMLDKVYKELALLGCIRCASFAPNCMAIARLSSASSCPCEKSKMPASASGNRYVTPFKSDG